MESRTRQLPTRDGRALQAQTTPGDGPAVVFEPGLGVSRAHWGRVQPEVARFAPTVVYDRAGFGASEPDPAGRTLERLADDLNDVLDAVGAAAYVLVGHSYGGPIVRRAAAARPERIHGLVLVDQSPEGHPGFYSASQRLMVGAAYALGERLARVGPLRRRMVEARAKTFADERAATDWRALESSPRTFRAARREYAEFPAGMARLRDAPVALPDVPVTVITGGRSPRGFGQRHALLTELHRREAAAAPRGRHVVAECGHLVPLDAPEIVVAEIRRLLP